jgi:hypothetical protein
VIDSATLPLPDSISHSDFSRPNSAKYQVLNTKYLLIKDLIEAYSTLQDSFVPEYCPAGLAVGGD